MEGMRPNFWIALVVGFVAVACGQPDSATDGPEIVVGSFAFSESEILGEVYAQGLEAAGYDAEHRAQIGQREIVKPLLEAGEIGLVPEYLGSALEVGFGRSPEGDAAAVRDALAAAYAPAGVSVLDLAPVENTNAFVVTRDMAESMELTTVSDLAKLEVVTLGGPPECPERPRCLIGLQTVYGLTVEFTALDAGGRLTLNALRNGDIDVGLFFSTEVFEADLVQLEDDLGLQPAENVVPVVRTELLDSYGDALADRINEISSRVTIEELIELNRQFSVEQRQAAAIASDWLDAMGLSS